MSIFNYGDIIYGSHLTSEYKRKIHKNPEFEAFFIRLHYWLRKNNNSNQTNNVSESIIDNASPSCVSFQYIDYIQTDVLWLITLSIKTIISIILM